MRTRLAVITGLIVTGALCTWSFSNWRQSVKANRMAEYEQNLTSASAPTRLRAARAILAADHRRDDAMLAMASALLDTRRYVEARQALDRLEHKPNNLQVRAALRLHAESYLREGEELVAAASPTTYDVSSEQLDTLLAGASSIRGALAKDGAGEAELALLEAREADLKGRLVRRALGARTEELAGAVAAASADEISEKGIIVTEMQRTLEKLDQTTAERCARAIELEPADPVAWRLLFRLRLQSGRFDEARHVAQQVAALPQRDPELAGYLAYSLLDLEAGYGQPVNPPDVDTAAQLLSGKPAADEPTLTRVARARLHLVRGEPAEAEKQARGVLQKSRNDTEATCVLALALVAQGRADDAVSYTQRYLDRLDTAEVRYALGVALLAQGRSSRAREALRQSLDMNGDLLPARLAVAQSLVDEGYVAEAKHDIEAAAALSPDHPAVKALQAHLFIDQPGRTELAGLLDRWIAGPGGEPDWRVVAMAAAMGLHDTARVAGYASQLLKDDAGHMPALVARAWASAEQKRQLDAAGVLLRALDRGWVYDPMSEAGPPPVRALAIADQVDAGAGMPSPLTEAVFVDWPERTALRLVEWGLTRWPDQPELLGLAGELHLWFEEPDPARQRFERLAEVVPDGGEAFSAAAARAYLNGADRAMIDSLARAMQDERDLTTFQYWLVTAWALREGDDPLTQQGLAHLLVSHPWPERPLLMVVRQGLNRGGPEGAQRWLDVCRGVRPDVARLAQARLDLQLNRSTDALHEIRMLLMDEDGGSQVRRLAAEVLVRTHLMTGQLGTALNLFDGLAMADHDQRFEMRLASLDLLMMARHTNNAAETVAAMLTDPDVPEYGIDPLVYRASLLLSGARFDNLLSNLIETHPHNPLLMVYKAQAARMDGQPPDVVRGWLDQALAMRPGSARVLVALAEQATARGDLTEAAKQYQSVIAAGGRAAHVAAQKLAELSKRGHEAATGEPLTGEPLRNEEASDGS